MPVLHPPTRREQWLRAVAYMFVAVVGIYTIIFPSPTAIENRLGLVSYIWAGFILTAIPAAIGSIMGRWRVEVICIPLFASALLVAVANGWASIVPNDPSAIPRMAISSALVLFCWLRWSQIHRIMKADPWITTEH